MYHAVSGKNLQRFELPPEEKHFCGDPDDRKAMLEHRQKVQLKVKSLEKEREEYIKKKRDQVMEERKQLTAGLRHLDAHYKKIQDEVKEINSRIKKLQNDLMKVREKAEKKSLDLSRPRKKTATKEPKCIIKYPIEDLQLHDAKSPFEPEWLDDESSSRVLDLLISADILLFLGSRHIGIKVPTFQDLHEMIKSSSKSSKGIDQTLDPEPLHTLYFNTLQLILNDYIQSGKASRSVKRWHHVLSEGSWQEVLRRFILSMDDDGTEPYERPNSHALLAASMLLYDPIESFTYDQHVAIFRFLCGSVLADSSTFRTILQSMLNLHNIARPHGLTSSKYCFKSHFLYCRERKYCFERQETCQR